MKKGEKYDVKEILDKVDLRTLIPLDKEKYHRGYKVGRCPFPGHTDKNPSFLVFKDGYTCLSTACGVKGNLFNWLGFIHNLDPNQPEHFKRLLVLASGEQFPAPLPKSENSTEEEPSELPSVLVETYHNMLGRSQRVYYLNRGLTTFTVDKEQLGWNGDQYVIPVWEGLPQKSKVLQLRFRASKLDQEKYSGISGFNYATIYNRQALLNESTYVAIFFGEFDALLAYQWGVNAVSPTNGSKSFKKEWVDSFLRKFTDVYVVPDKGEEEDAERIERLFGSRAQTIILPYGEGEKDLTDLVLVGWPPQSFWDLIESRQEVESYWEAR